MLKAIGISFHFSDTFPLGSTAFPEVVISLFLPWLARGVEGAGGLHPLQRRAGPRGPQAGEAETEAGSRVLYVMAVGLRAPAPQSCLGPDQNPSGHAQAPCFKSLCRRLMRAALCRLP